MVTSARYKELIGLVKNELLYLKADLDSKNMKCELIAGIVITGGGAQIEDLKECAAEVFGTHAQVRIGSPLNITGLTDYVNKPQYATVIGLLQYGHSNEDEGPINEEHTDSHHYMIELEYGIHLTRTVFHRVLVEPYHRGFGVVMEHIG